jgi:hypothetical protein
MGQAQVSTMPKVATSIYRKLGDARNAFHALQLKKSGKNTFAGYSYFELSDFLIPGLKCMSDSGLMPVVSFENSRAVMRIFDMDSDAVIEIESPRAEANLKGCHPIQNLGAEETYQRRYLWMAALEIVEHDALDSSPPVETAKAAPDVSEAIKGIYNAPDMDSLQKAFAAAYKLYSDSASRKTITAAKDRRKGELA